MFLVVAIPRGINEIMEVGTEMRDREGDFPGLLGVHVKPYRFTARSGRIPSGLVA
jgi:hypothetical protein